MFKVPLDTKNPTWASAHKVGFFRWLFSNKHERHLWRQLREAARKHALDQRLTAIKQAAIARGQAIMETMNRRLDEELAAGTLTAERAQEIREKGLIELAKMYAA